MAKTSIEWTEATWNAIRGCSPVSPGCKNCYAERQGGRFAGPGRPFDGFIQIGKNGNPGPRWTGKVELIPHMLDIPLRSRKPTTYFVNSMSDLFHEELPDEAIDRVFAVMALCPQHTFQVLTKRAKRMLEYLSDRDEWIAQAVESRNWAPGVDWDARDTPPLDRWPLSNVWLGVSVEDQQRADERIPLLLQTPAAVRFVSAEPLLGRINIEPYVCRDWRDGTSAELPKLDCVIAGGESGPGARPCELAWIRSIKDQCEAAGVACFVKQLGADPYLDVASTDRRGLDPSTGLRIWPHSQTLWQGCEAHTKLSDRKGGLMEEWPEDLRVRQMPGRVTA